MKIIGLTGGIGAGKSTVIAMFEAYGTPVYIADTAAKRLMHSSQALKKAIQELLGDEAYKKDELNKEYIASIVFSTPQKLAALNALVHPAVRQDFMEFLKRQNAPYVLYESALLLADDNHNLCDEIILVSTPEEIRIQRVLERDATNVAQIKARIENQLSDEEMRLKSHYIIENLSLEGTQKCVDELHKYFS
ncbi:MAG: dephospho-CoA kinase [Flavicella sp.]